MTDIHMSLGCRVHSGTESHVEGTTPILPLSLELLDEEPLNAQLRVGIGDPTLHVGIAKDLA